MTDFTNKLAALVCTLVLSVTMIAAAVGPAEAGFAPSVVSTARVA